MPSIDRPLKGEVLVLDLERERTEASGSDALERSGRSARTLLKNGPLRVTLVVLAPGGELAEHQADGPITVQPLEGRLRFVAAGKEQVIGPGELLSADGGVRHSVSSTSGAAFLLTVAQPG